MIFGDAVKFSHVSFGLIPEIFDAIDVVFSACKKFGMIDAEVFKIGNIQGIIGRPTVGVNDAVGGNFSQNYGHKGF